MGPGRREKKGRFISGGGSVRYTGSVLVVPERYKEVFAELDDLAQKKPVVRGISEEFVGVHEGIKPVALLEAGDTGEWSDGEWSHIERIAEALKMEMLAGDDGQYLLSRDKLMAEELKVLLLLQAYMRSEGVEKNCADRQEVERKIGGMLGFPETSTEAFLGNIERLPDEMMYEKIGEKNGRSVYEYKIHDMRYADSVLSLDYYKEELEVYAKPIRRAIQELLPRIYAREDFKIML